MKIRFGARIRCTRCYGYFHSKRMKEKLGLIRLIQSSLLLGTKVIWIIIINLSVSTTGFLLLDDHVFSCAQTHRESFYANNYKDCI
jgi:hypothetical protein